MARVKSEFSQLNSVPMGTILPVDMDECEKAEEKLCHKRKLTSPASYLEVRNQKNYGHISMSCKHKHCCES